MDDNERTWLIGKLEGYKTTLENRKNSLMDELSRYPENSSISHENESTGDFKDIKFDIYNNPYETYLIAQIKIAKALPLLLEEHMVCMKMGIDLDMVLDSLEFEVYKVKKNVYVNIREWENLINHLSDYRLLEIANNPKGPGDLIIKELCWIRDYEKKWR